LSPDRIRICYVLNNFGIGGAETVVLDLARRHDPSQFEVEVVAALEPRTDGEPEMRRRFREAGVKTAIISQDNFRSPQALWRLFRYLRRGRFDIVHGHNRGSDYWAAKLGALAGIPHRFWTRHLVYLDMSPKQIRRYSSLSRKSDRVLAVSDAVNESCRSVEEIPAEKVVTVVNGIDLEKYAPLALTIREAKRRQLSHPEGDALLLFVGRFSDQKAPESFLDLVWKLRGMGVPVTGYMAGHGPLAGKLEKMVDEGPGGVTILGLRSDVPELLGACDLFVSTSRNEGLPLNVMEAMSAGAMFVAPGIDQIRELVVGEPLFDRHLTTPPPLEGDVPAATVGGWADIVKEVLADPERPRIMGKLGRAIIHRDYSLGKMVVSYEDIFLTACGRDRSEMTRGEE
jgi:glycosyltransferase involved in cell wall biosynthesis